MTQIFEHYLKFPVLQVAKRKARGYKAKHFKTMAFLLTGKLDFTAQNPYLPT